MNVGRKQWPEDYDERMGREGETGRVRSEADLVKRGVLSAELWRGYELPPLRSFHFLSCFLLCSVMCLRLFFYLSISMFICLSVGRSVHLFVYQSVCLSVYQSVCLSVYLSISLLVCLSICLSVILLFYQLINKIITLLIYLSV